MAATSQPRNTQQLVPPPGVIPSVVSVPIADNVVLYPGTLAVIKAGYLAPAATETGDLPAGRVSSGAPGSGVTVYDNTVAGHGAGAFEVPVDCGIFKWGNAGTITQANVGALAYAVDNQTVTATSTGASAIGRIVRVDTDGVYVLSFIGQM